MASSAHARHLSRERIIANAREQKTAQTDRDDAGSVPSQDDNVAPVLSQPVKAKVRKNRRKKQDGGLVGKVGLLGAIVVTGIAIIIGLRYLAETFGINWIGD